LQFYAIRDDNVLTYADYDAWGELGAEGWEWKGLLPYFKKACLLTSLQVELHLTKHQSENFTPAAESYAKEFNISWDKSVHGNGGPIQSSYPVFQFPSISKPSSGCFLRMWLTVTSKTQKTSSRHGIV
jgi:hypothetical protein